MKHKTPSHCQNPFPLPLVKRNKTSKPLPVAKIVVCLLLEAVEIHVIGRCYVSVFLGEQEIAI